MIEGNKIYNESCLDTMKRMDDNSVDSIITDPPYGYSFMGKDWDKVVPSVEIWSECFRVMKAGSFAFIMSAPRQDVLSHMIINLDKAGFDTSFTSIYWTYASGFPKAMNVGKSVMKRNGDEGEVVGKSKYEGRRPNNWGGNENGNNTYGDYNAQPEMPIIKPTCDEAKALDGSYGGFQPKPAIEIIIVVMKPLSEKSLTEQAISNGKGITWLDDCRVPTREESQSQGAKITSNTNGKIDVDFVENKYPQELGRFPANLLVSDDVLNDGKVYAGQQGEVTGDEPSTEIQGNTYGDYRGQGKPMQPRNDAGSFSRYYDLDKWWEERIKSLPKNVMDVFPFLIVPKAAKSEKNFGVSGEDKPIEGRDAGQDERNMPHKNRTTPRKNQHPTVKPIKLMSYLITLGSRENDLIYDPFSGSGTTLVSAEITKRKFVGSELSAEYCKIANERLLPFTSAPTLF